MEPLVCPECGCRDFVQDCTALVRRTMQFQRTNGMEYPTEVAEEILDVERDADITCTDCGHYIFEPLLITEQVPPRPRPLFDSSDIVWQEAMKLAEATGCRLTDAYDQLRNRNTT